MIKAFFRSHFLTSIESSFQFKLEESTPSTESGNSQSQKPTSPTNGTTQDPLKATVISSVPRRQNSSDSAPAEKESPVTPNRSDDDKGELDCDKRPTVVNRLCLKRK